MNINSDPWEEMKDSRNCIKVQDVFLLISLKYMTLQSKSYMLYGGVYNIDGCKTVKKCYKEEVTGTSTQ